MHNTEHSLGRKLALATIGLFILSRIAIYSFIEFRFDRLGEAMQLLDLNILRDDLLNGVWHLHVQPPLYNLITGIFLKIVPSGIQSITLALLYSLIGLGITLGTYRLMTLRGIRPLIAFIIATGLSVSPIMVWGERIPSYLYPIAGLLVLAALALHKFVATKRIGYGLLFLLAVGCLPLTRSFFHLIFWMIPVVLGMLFLAFKLDRKRFIVYAALGGIFLAGTFGIYVKNYLSFGAFTGSTWQGMNIAGVVSLTPPQNIQRLVEEGKATRLALVPRFADPGVYYRYYGTPIENTIPALDDTLRSTGYVNWNNRIYAVAAHEYQRNAFAIARAYPFQVVQGVANGTWLLCSFSTYKLFNDPAEWWIPRRDSALHTVMDIGLVYLIPLAVAALLVITIGRFLRTCRKVVRRNASLQQPQFAQTACDLFTGFTVLYTAVIAVAAELGEQSLMRAQVEPFLGITVGIVVERIVRSRCKA